MSIFPKSEYRILRLIYENPGIRLGALMSGAKVSSATAKERLSYLVNSEIITEEKIIGGKRVILKRYYSNLSSEEGKHIFALIESGKKQEFFKKYRELSGPFKQLIKNLRSVKVILIFGSFAKHTPSKDSDIDILLLTAGKIDKKQLGKEIERSFITISREVSTRIDTLNNFKTNINNPVYQTIIKNHIIIKGTADYIKLIGGVRNLSAPS